MMTFLIPSYSYVFFKTHNVSHQCLTVLFLECLYIGLALAMQHWLLPAGSLAMQKQVWFVLI